jgi:hypothetical protein
VKSKFRVTILLGALGVAAAIWSLFASSPQHDVPVTLSFQRYSHLDPYVGDVAFLWLTNASSKPCLLTMTGGTNTLVLDTSFGQFKQSWMVNCEFSDQTPGGRTNWIQQPSPFGGSTAYASLAPHSGIVVRVSVPPSGHSRKVAVLYEPALAGWRQSPFWTSACGRGVLRVLVRTLPKRALLKLADPRPVLSRAWCDRQLTNQWDRINHP